VNGQQLQAILWLRWRLTRNQWTRSQGLGAALTALAAVVTGGLGVGSFVGALLAGLLWLDQAKSSVVLIVWTGLTIAFLFLWLLGLVNELQRSETIDLQRLLHLPVALGQIFVINYLASHFALSVVVFVPAMLGLALGLAISRGPALLLLVPLALGTVFMVTAWTYYLRNWLAKLMSNPRRRRSIIMSVTLGLILLAQSPNIYFNVFRAPDNAAATRRPEEAQGPRQAQQPTRQERLSQLLAVQKFLPPLWLSVGAQALVEGHVWPALLGTFGCWTLGALGLRRAYSSSLRLYHGELDGKAVGPLKRACGSTPTATPVPPGRRFLEWQIPGVPEQATALALATLRSMLRAPEVKMAWAASFIVTVVIGGAFLFRSAPNIPGAAKPFIATGAVALPIFMLVQFLANQFGFDRDGFRALILSPADRKLFLLGKNLACLPVGVGFGLTLLLLVAFWLRLPTLALAAGLLQLVALLLIAGIAGNVLSILVPYRIQAGSMKPTKMPGLAMLAMVFCHLLFPVVMVPAFVPALAELLWQLAGWPEAVPVNLVFSVLLVALTALAYWRALAPLGRLLHRRETKILAVVTVEVE